MAQNNPSNDNDCSPLFVASFLRDTLGNADPDMLSKFYTLLLEQIAPMTDTLQELAAAGDIQAVREYAHKLKSSTRAVGAQALGDQLEVIEHAARDGDLGRAQEMISSLGRLAADTETEVRREMARLQKP
jgi:HPt (histidine-containing phosphotransfer) domain-containing protein